MEHLITEAEIKKLEECYTDRAFGDEDVLRLIAAYRELQQQLEDARNMLNEIAGLDAFSVLDRELGIHKAQCWVHAQKESE